MRIWIPLLLLWCSPAWAGVDTARSAFAAGRAALEAGEQARALEAFQAAADHAPTWLLPALEIGELAAQRREGMEEARARLAALEPAGASNPRFHRVVGDLLELLGQERQAVDAWGRSLELLPDEEVLRKKAGALERLGRHLEAVEAYGRLVALHPHDFVYRARLAHALEQAGKHEEAQAQLRILVDRQPGKEAPLRRLARFYERRGQQQEAARWHREADRAGGRQVERRMRPLPASRR
jgi:tetratricopeptide (TPR) repeat protein